MIDGRTPSPIDCPFVGSGLFDRMLFATGRREEHCCFSRIFIRNSYRSRFRHLCLFPAVAAPHDPYGLYRGRRVCLGQRDSHLRRPTPKDPVALRLAARDPSPSVAYVARPCQYVMDTRGRGCSAAYWANGRFAPEVIEAEAAAIRALMVRVGATKLRIVGYSGGATVALLLPRYGIQPTEIITVAGVLDPTAWVRKLVRAMVVAASRVGRADFSPNFQRTGAGPDVSFPCWASSNLQSFAQQQEWVKSGISTNRAGDSGERCLRYERTTSVPTVRSCPPVK